MREMNTYEFDAYWGWGEMPERFWIDETRKLTDEYLAGKLSQAELEDSLDDMMGISRLQGYNGTFSKSTADNERWSPDA
jgi:hypothetical protein